MRERTNVATHLCAGIKALCTVSCVKEKCFIPLNSCQLETKALDLLDLKLCELLSNIAITLRVTSAGVTRGGKELILVSTLSWVDGYGESGTLYTMDQTWRGVLDLGS